MKKLILILMLFITTLLNARCICYYMNYDPNMAKIFFKPTCEYYTKVMEQFGFSCEIKPYAYYLDLPYIHNDIIIIVGEGNYEGLFLTHPKEVAEDYHNAIFYRWEDLANDLNASVAIIDACYSGYIHDYPHSNVAWLITSAGEENSWNIIDDYGRNVSSLSAALRCKYDKSYKCPIGNLLLGGCFGMNINECQMNLIIKAMSVWKSVNFYDWEYPSAGTCMLNGKPCSYYLH